MSKHTPGPWFDAGRGWIEADGEREVLTYEGCGSHSAHWNNRADFDLVLAAPDLLEALIDLRDLYDTDEGCRSTPEYLAASAAIAKATGEKP